MNFRVRLFLFIAHDSAIIDAYILINLYKCDYIHYKYIQCPKK